MPADSKKHNSSGKTSDELIEELLETIRNRDKKDPVKEEKEKKHHKHKKEKKKKHKHRSRSRERKHKRNRSRSKEKRKSKKKRHRKSSQSSVDEDNLPKKPKNDYDDDRLEPSCSTANVVDDDDDLPAGADFQTVLEEARNSGNDLDLPPLNLSKLPCEPGRKLESDKFPLSKDRKDNEDGTSHPKKESEVLKKVIESKGPGDFVPRNVKLKKDLVEESSPKDDSPQDSAPLIDLQPKTIKFNIKIPSTEGNKKEREKPKEVENAEEFGPEPPSEESDSTERKKESKIPTKNTNKDWEVNVKPLLKDEKSIKDANKLSKEDTKEINEKPRKDSKNRKKSRSRSPRKKSRSPERKEKRRSRSRKRSKSRDRKRSRSRSRDRRRRSRSGNRRSRSRSRDRRGRGSRSRSRSRDRKGRGGRKRSWSRGRRSRSRTWSRGRSRSRSRSEERIDKAKLLQIAKKRRAAGIFDIGDDNSKSVEDFVSYCEKLQRRQEKEDRRERGEAVSDNESDVAAPTFKHSYKPLSEPIKINIVNAVPIPTKTTEECIMDSAALRVVYPVSSGSIHRESAEWQKVDKDSVPLTCSAVQKNFKAITTLEAEKIRKKATQLQQAPAFLLPPPPAPPALPPPPIPPVLTAFDTLLPPPPPAPSTLLIPPEDKMIMKEPEEISAIPPRNVADVLAKRAKAQRQLQEDPNDFDALRDLKLANDQSLPGKFNGSTGVKTLSAEELQPDDPRGHAWVKKDMFKAMMPNFGSGIGMRLMQRMGWKPGTGLGREATGSLEPLMLDVKNDRKGLATEDDLPARAVRNFKNIPGTDLSGKHPVSLVMELCAKRKWPAPAFTCLESGPPHQREFIWKVVVNGTEYCSATSSKNKKDGKSVACQVVLQSMGLVPRDPTLPVII